MANEDKKNKKKSVKKESESDIELAYINNERTHQKKICFFCQYSFFLKRILRLVIREYPLYMTILLIRLNILDGSIILHKRKKVNFLRLNKNQSGFYPSGEDLASRSKEYWKKPGMKNNRKNDRIERNEEVNRLERFRRYFVRSLNINRRNAISERSMSKDNKDDCGIIDSFLSRLAENLHIESHSLEGCIDHVITSYNDILLDINFQKLTRESAKSEEVIEYTIINMFWQPKALKTSKRKNRHDNTKNDLNNDDSWFKAVDRGCVVPFYSNIYTSYFNNSSIDRISKNLFNKCIHEIEENSLNYFSWYIDEYFYHDIVYRRNTFSYEQYLNYQKLQKICNPKVTVDKTNPLELCIPFAHVITSNFYSHHKYVRNYMRDIHLFSNSMIRIDKDIPFIVRSLNPLTRMHIFHIVYKKYFYTRPTYENLFKGLVLLKDAMCRLKLKDLAMCKIGCCCERLDFDKVIRMTEFIFLNTNINVRIGLNLMKCCHFKSRSVKYDHDECVDLHLKRIDRYFSYDTNDTSKTDEYSSDED
ncbi:uncharacterized protein LOC118444428 [Vespa mandarinia]|uniref:uncharacterized protein LOC118444428 n=1 Tax=Vespa mandarinia TaxID=7446 RepID=UPI00160EB6A2|nr:uncharacterized protein LOC118444428 [Vespa mandarinia]